MAQYDLKNAYDARLNVEGLSSGTDVEPEGEFSLEEILAEYGGSRQQQILDEVEQDLSAAQKTDVNPLEKDGTLEKESAADGAVDLDTDLDPSPPKEPMIQAEATPPPEEPSDSGAAPPPVLTEEELPPPPQPVSIELAVGQTVDSVMEEYEEQPPEKRFRRGLFSRKKFEDTEQLFAPPEPPPEPEPEEEPIGFEESLEDAAKISLKAYHRMHRPLVAAVIPALILLAPQIAQYFGYEIPFWTGDLILQSILSAVALILMCILCHSVFTRGFSRLMKHCFTGELLMAFSAIAALLDCAARIWLPSRSDVPLYALPACVGLLFGQWGCAQREKGRYDTFRTAALDTAPPYLVTDLEKGACKQSGRIPGFWTDAVSISISERWQAILLPVVFVSTLVFAGLGSLGRGRSADFILNWSAILAGSAALVLPLTDTLPASRLARRLQKAGCAVAGCAGAEKISQKKSMIVSDQDLFPPGTVFLNGVKLFGEEMPKVVSYGASLARASGCGLRRLFDNLLVSEGGHLETLDDFSFYEEGGFSANIHGESVLLGTASFMRKMEVRLPSGLNLRTGVFLSIDRQLAAVFAVKYQPSENVDWALRLMRRNHITPILASRDPNVNPALLKRKFTAKIKVEFPSLSTRLALSEQEDAHGRPRALLLREGLLPYAETVTGSRRLCSAVRTGTILALLGSVAGTLLTFYLTGLGSYALMDPLRLLVFLLLWTLPVFLLDNLAGRY